MSKSKDRDLCMKWVRGCRCAYCRFKRRIVHRKRESLARHELRVAVVHYKSKSRALAGALDGATP